MRFLLMLRRETCKINMEKKDYVMVHRLQVLETSSISSEWEAEVAPAKRPRDR